MCFDTWNIHCVGKLTNGDGSLLADLTRYNKFAKSPQMAVDKEAISLSRVYSYYSKCNLSLFYV